MHGCDEQVRPAPKADRRSYAWMNASTETGAVNNQPADSVDLASLYEISTTHPQTTFSDFILHIN